MSVTLTLQSLVSNVRGKNGACGSPTTFLLITYKSARRTERCTGSSRLISIPVMWFTNESSF